MINSPLSINDFVVQEVKEYCKLLNIKEDFISLRPKSNHQMKLPWKTVKLRSAKKKKKETVENREKMFKYVKHPVKKKLPPKRKGLIGIGISVCVSFKSFIIIILVAA